MHCCVLCEHWFFFWSGYSGFVWYLQLFHKLGRYVFTHISLLSMLGWKALAYLGAPWAEMAPFPCQHPLTPFRCQERNSASCQYTSSVGDWADKEPMHHWAEGEVPVSQSEFLKWQPTFCQCSPVVFPWFCLAVTQGISKEQERQASSYSPQTLLSSHLRVLRVLQYLLVLWLFLVSSAERFEHYPFEPLFFSRDI